MPRRNIRIGADTRPWQDLLDSVHFPNEEAIAALTRASGEMFGYLDARVPVETGALRATGKLTTEVENRDEFAATMSWGGPTPPGYPSKHGPEITYAPQAFHHAHTFDGVESTYEQFEEAMFAGLNGPVSEWSRVE